MGDHPLLTIVSLGTLILSLTILNLFILNLSLFEFCPASIVTLLALSTMLRTSEIASIDRGSVDFRPGCVSFALSKPTKTQHQGPLKSFSIKSLDDPSIDPVKTLRDYYRFTEQFRDEGNSKLLLIGLSKPHKPVGRSTVGHWIKNLLRDAGVDASFSAHSTRGAAASKAARAGLPINSILLAASWRAESTFTKFYRRDVIQPSVADAILSQGIPFLL